MLKNKSTSTERTDLKFDFMFFFFLVTLSNDFRISSQSEKNFGQITSISRLHFRARLHLSILPHCNRAGLCSPPGLGSENSARIVATWPRAVIHQLFAAPGVDTCDYPLTAKFAASTETLPNLL